MIKRLLIAVISVCVLILPSIARAQSSGYALEVTYFKGRPFAYQRIGQWSWYALFQRVQGWKPAAGDGPVEAVKITPRVDEGSIKVRVSVLKGKYLDNEQPVGDYAIAEDARITITELTKFGVVPFEVGLVRAPATVSSLPAVVNKTRSLQVSVEPNISSLPTFRLKLLNDSTKAVRAFSYETWVDGKQRLSGMPNKPGGAVLIEPGAANEQEIRFPLDAQTTSTGEAPAALPDLTVVVTSVVFADGTYEGEIAQAARYRAMMLGERTQLKRILEVLRTDTSAVSLDVLNAQVSDLTWYVDEPAFEAFVKGIGGLSEKVKEDLRDSVQVASNDLQKNFVAEFGEKRNSMSDKPAEFQAWLKTAAERYQKWLSALPQ